MRLLRSWSAGKLFTSWIAYWILLLAIGLAPAIGPIWRATHAEPDKGSLNMSFGSDGFSLNVLKDGATLYSASIHLLPLALLVAGPPLLLWLLWVASRSKRGNPDAVIGR
ncbi:MAG TPA: hypothetical protein VGP95_05400 [Gemmatimonadaceae bacterium]|nr:hypothetical protein [Gemmatimonadaceae bacterium]